MAALTSDGGGVGGKIVPAERKLVENICKEKKKEDPATAPGIKVQDGPKACFVLALPLEPEPSPEVKLRKSPHNSTDYVEFNNRDHRCTVYSGGFVINSVKGRQSFGTVTPKLADSLLDKIWGSDFYWRSRAMGMSAVPKHYVAIGSHENNTIYRTSRGDVDLTITGEAAKVAKVEKEALGLCRSAKVIATMADRDADQEILAQTLKLVKSGSLPAWLFSFSTTLGFAETGSARNAWTVSYSVDSVTSELVLADITSGKTTHAKFSGPLKQEDLVKILERAKLFINSKPEKTDQDKVGAPRFSLDVQVVQLRMGYMKNFAVDGNYVDRLKVLLEAPRQLHKAREGIDPSAAIESKWKKAMSSNPSTGTTNLSKKTPAEKSPSPTKKANVENNLSAPKKICKIAKSTLPDDLGPGFSKIIGEVRMVPALARDADGKMRGFKIFAIDDASIIARIGLKNGDIILKINGKPLDQPEKGFLFFQELEKREGEVKIELERRKEPMTIDCKAV